MDRSEKEKALADTTTKLTVNTNGRLSWKSSRFHSLFYFTPSPNVFELRKADGGTLEGSQWYLLKCSIGLVFCGMQNCLSKRAELSSSLPPLLLSTSTTTMQYQPHRRKCEPLNEYVVDSTSIKKTTKSHVPLQKTEGC